jgi:hypothetical protein
MDFLVRRDDLRECRFDAAPVPEPSAGQALLEVESFSLTSNNVTYAVMGDAMSYWRFFPAQEGWGRVPVWGFARVAASAHDDVREGSRVYGYLPPSSHHLVVPERVKAGGFVEGSPHRAELPAVYNSYVPAADEPGPGEDRQALFRPLFGTSFVIDDFLDESQFFGAGSVLLGSASSKTALGTAFLLARREDVESVGLTSPSNAEFVRGLDVYDRVVTYDEIDSLPDTPAVYVDMSGDAAVRGAVHRHYGEALAYDCAVGVSHWEKAFADPGPLPGPAPQLFFAPDRFRKRTEDWGPGGLQEKVSGAWDPFEDWLSGWLEVVHGSGPEDVERTYLELVDGRTSPSTGYVMSLPV